MLRIRALGRDFFFIGSPHSAFSAMDSIYEAMEYSEERGRSSRKTESGPLKEDRP